MTLHYTDQHVTCMCCVLGTACRHGGQATRPGTWPDNPRVNAARRVTGVILGLIGGAALCLSAVTQASAAGISLSPSNGAPGTSFTVSGSGFTRNSNVTISWDSSQCGQASTNHGGA